MKKIQKYYKVNFDFQKNVFEEEISNPFVKSLSMQCVEYLLDDGVTLCRTIATEQNSNQLKREISLPMITQLQIEGVWVSQVTEKPPFATGSDFVNVSTQKPVEQSEALEYFYDENREMFKPDGESYEPKKYFKTTAIKEGYLSSFDNHLLMVTSGLPVNIHDTHKHTIIYFKGLTE